MKDLIKALPNSIMGQLGFKKEQWLAQSTLEACIHIMNQLSPIMGENAIGKGLKQEEVKDFSQQSSKIKSQDTETIGRFNAQDTEPTIMSIFLLTC